MRIRALVSVLLAGCFAMSGCAADDPAPLSGDDEDGGGSWEAEAQDDESEPPARVDYRRDGTVEVGDQRFDSVEDFHTSEAFIEGGHRCATQHAISAEQLIVEGDQADCAFNSTSIDPVYNPDTVYRIPVVFHVIKRSNGEGNLSESQIESQVEVLNEDFRAMSGSAGEEGNDARIEFELADVDPDGNPTSGINYHTNDQWFSDPGPGQQNSMKQNLAWDPDNYLNIYTNDSAGALGYATFPQQSAGSQEDGVVLLWNSVGKNAPGGGAYDQGRTATHEVGHYLGLFHTFQDGCQDASNPYSTGDRIADTASHTNPDNSCQARNSSCGTGVTPIHNYMNYSPDSCMHEFTEEQINRMRCSLVNFRESLIVLDDDDAGETDPDPQPDPDPEPEAPEADFEADTDALTVEFEDLSSSGSSSVVDWEWDFGDGQSSTQASPTHTYDESGTYSVTLEVTNDEGLSDATASNVTVEPPSSEGGELAAGAEESELSGGSGDEIHFYIDVPENTEWLDVEMFGGTGDADLYVRAGQAPTESDWDCRPYEAGNDEECTFDEPEEGRWYVMVRGFQAFSGVSLVADFEVGDDSDQSTPPGGDPGDDDPVDDDDGDAGSDDGEDGQALVPGQVESDLSADSGDEIHFYIDVPTGADALDVEMFGGSGDADLYVRFGEAPTESNWDCRPYVAGNDEECSFDDPEEGRWYVMVRGFQTFADVSLVADIEGGDSGDDDDGGQTDDGPTTMTESGLSAPTDEELHYQVELPSGVGEATFEITGGTGDADIYVRHGAQPTTSTYDYRPFLVGNEETVEVDNPDAGTWYIMVRAYEAFDGVTLNVSYE